ncbi:auxin-responsive protein SAUR50-like [Typha angustifolia]|uniref:auxin-responsive protein SAUR50-like n=1 Tax=Typha angustifolia TaxID=59011 RepID=UPI003C305945
MGKCSKIHHIVRLRQILRRWRKRAGSAAAAPPPEDVPAGHVAVCVGSSSRRFVVRAAHLNHPAFRQLLRQAEEEYGFPSEPGPIALPCDESLFEQILRRISDASSSRPAPSTCCCCDHVGIRRGGGGGWRRGDSVPLLGGGYDEKTIW